MSCTLDLDRGPTLEELLRGCIDAFDAQGKVRDPHLVRLFLTMHSWYLPPSRVAARLRSAVAESGGSADGPTLRLKICHLVRYWVRAFPGEVVGDPQLLEEIRALREELGGGGGGPLPHIDLESLLEAEATPTEDAPPPAAAETTPGAAETPPAGPEAPPPAAEAPPPARRKAALLLERLEAAEVAALLTHLEHRARAPLRLQDYRRFVRRGDPRDSAALQRVVALSNGVSRWVQLLVLSPPSAPQRAHVLARFLHVAQKLLELRNFGTLMAVVGGLGHGSIARLHQTLSLLPPDATELWGRLSEAVGSAGNYRRYRGLLGGAEGGPGGGPGGGWGWGGALPALGVHLRDLMALEAALPDWGGPARPHPHKLQQRFAILGGLVGGAPPAPPPLPAHPHLLHLLTVSLELGPTEAQLYELSLQREPRTRPPSRPPPALPLPRPPQEWACPAPPPPDPALLRAHLEQLVESIFRHYDVDGDGRISPEEFGIVRRNFPQLRRFGDIDSDRDGALSRGEVLAFFLRCSRGPPPPPPHRLEPTRPLRPTACAHCRRTILGLHKQALKCLSCGLRCHPHCGPRLRVECRRRTQSVADPPPETPRPPPRSLSLSLPPAETPEELQELEDGVFDTHL